MENSTSVVDPSLINYRTIIRPEVCTDGSTGYLAVIPDLPGCMSFGRTVEEARTNVEDAKREYILALRDQGRSIPAPAISSVASIEWRIVVGSPAASFMSVTQPATTNVNILDDGVAGGVQQVAS